MSSLKISALLASLALAGCVTTAPDTSPAASGTSTGSVQVECGAVPTPGCREPAVPKVYAEWEQKMAAELKAADELRASAVESMSTLPTKQQIPASETITTEQAFQSTQAKTGRNVKVLDSVVIDLPWAAKSRAQHKEAMNAIKDIATLMADNRGGATIFVTVSPRDLRAKKVNLKSGSAPTEAGNVVEVKKSADKDVPPGIEHFVIQAKPWSSSLN